MFFEIFMFMGIFITQILVICFVVVLGLNKNFNPAASTAAPNASKKELLRDVIRTMYTPINTNTIPTSKEYDDRDDRAYDDEGNLRVMAYHIDNTGSCVRLDRRIENIFDEIIIEYSNDLGIRVTSKYYPCLTQVDDLPKILHVCTKNKRDVSFYSLTKKNLMSIIAFNSKVFIDIKFNDIGLPYIALYALNIPSSYHYENPAQDQLVLPDEVTENDIKRIIRECFNKYVILSPIVIRLIYGQ